MMACRRHPLATTLALAIALGAGAQGRAWAQELPSADAAPPHALTSRIELPGGGAAWATEDPALARPVLGLQGASMVAVEHGRIADPVAFHGYTNYPAFIARLEVAIYAGSDADLVTPLAVLPIPVAGTMEAKWDGALPGGILQPGDTLLYVARAWDKDGNLDETLPGRIQLVTPAERARGLQTSRDRVRKTLGQDLQGDAAQSLEASTAVYGRDTLRRQNIAVNGSRVRITGNGLAPGSVVSLAGRPIPVDQEGKFAAEFLEPVGEHRYPISVRTRDGERLEDTLGVDVSGQYSFMVALADLTVHGDSGSATVAAPATTGSDDDDILSDGRLAFYMRRKFGGRYLLTAQADTGERELDHLMDGFLKATPQDIFRRLDPDQYYPVYGDDSSTWRDVDTQGRLYMRLDWDRNQALWGNFRAGITGNEYAQYDRALYGAALDWRSRAATNLGEPLTHVRAFGSEAQSAPGHNEFLGTGGSLYYLHHADVLPGSESVVLEVRDPTTGRTEARTVLQRGSDYEIDEMQGRILLTRPLAQVVRENVRSLTRDAPLDGYEQRLLVDYEYVPPAFDPDNASFGFNGRQWLGEHVALGGTWIEENRSGEDYALQGADLLLQAGRGTYLKVERSHSESTVAPVFYSDDGGLGFVQRNPATSSDRSGDASAVEARANLRELGWTQRDWSTAAWWRDVTPGFSVSRLDTGEAVHEYGAEILGWLGESLSVYGRYSQAERGQDAYEQAQLTFDWRLDDANRFGAELRRLRQRTGASDVDATLAAVSYRHRASDALELYGTGQFTLDDDHGAYPRNDLLTLGAQYLFGDKSSIGAEASAGSRGHGALVNAEYRLQPDHTAYAAWRYSTDTTREPLFASRDNDNGLTLGQRWRLGSQVNVYNESQWLKDRDAGSSGIAHTFGLDFMPSPGWNLGFTIMDGELDNALGTTHRRAYSVSGGRTDRWTQWASKLEYRRDSGAADREQWVTSNRLSYQVNEDWRVALRANYADTHDKRLPAADATLSETSLGFAWRPHDSTRWAAFGRYTYLYDVASLGQVGGAQYDQRTQVLSLEGVHRFDARWEIAGKLATRRGDYRLGRGSGDWLEATANFASLQLRYRLAGKWDGLAEYRHLGAAEGGASQGWLLGIDRQVGDHLRIGAGYNFTGFSDDLSDLRQDDHGWFLNLAGYY
jgi:hypothetical protein